MYLIKKQKRQLQTSENEVLGQGGNPCPFCVRGMKSKMTEKKVIQKNLMKDCLPTVFSLMLSGLYSVMDGLFVGRAAGDIGLAAVNLAWPIVAVITATGIGIGSGGSVLFSNLTGKAEKEESEKTYHLTVCLLVGVGMALSVLLFFLYPMLLKLLGARGGVLVQAEAYVQIIILGCVFQIIGSGMIPLLRNRGMAVSAMVSMITGMFVNLVLNYVLIFKVGLGIRGAALGTIAAQLSVIFICIYLIYIKGGTKMQLIWNWRRSAKIFQIGLSAFGLSLAPSIVLIFTNLQCLKYGGDAAVACYAVISYVVFPVQSMLVGVGDGSQPLMSFYCGAEKKEELAYIKKTASASVIILGAVMLAIVVAVSDFFPAIFGMSKQSEQFFHVGMRISAVSFLFTGLAKFHISCLNATLRVKPAMALIYGETLLIAPVFIFLLPAILGITGIWWSLAATQIMMLLLYQIVKKKVG